VSSHPADTFVWPCKQQRKHFPSEHKKKKMEKEKTLTLTANYSNFMCSMGSKTAALCRHFDELGQANLPRFRVLAAG